MADNFRKRRARQRRRQQRVRYVFVVALLLLVVAIILSLVLQDSGNRAVHPVKPAAPGSAESTPSGASAQPTRPPDQSLMRQELAKFVEAYYRISPDSTTASRQAAVMQQGVAISPDALSSMDFTVYTNDDASQLRINNRLVISGSLQADSVRILSSQDHGRLVYVGSPVTVTTSWPDGRVYSTHTETIGTVWRWQPDGSWMMTSFGTGS